MAETEPAKLTLKFHGMDSMDARTLGETLTAVQDLFDAVHESLHGPDAPPVTLKVTGFHYEEDEEAPDGPVG